MSLNSRSASPENWNIFARELKTILAAHNKRIEDLPGSISLFSQTARQLEESLSQPGLFPVLTVDEISNLKDIYGLTFEEEQRLMAAIVVTAFEDILMVYIDRKEALSIANSTLPRVFDALLAGVDDDETTRGDSFIKLNDEDQRIMFSVNNAKNAGDSAMHRAQSTLSSKQRQSEAQTAHDYFERAIAALDRVSPQLRASEGWQNLHDHLQERLRYAQSFL